MKKKIFFYIKSKRNLQDTETNILSQHLRQRLLWVEVESLVRYQTRGDRDRLLSWCRVCRRTCVLSLSHLTRL